MAIYDRPVGTLIREMVRELAPQRGVIFSGDDAIAGSAMSFQG